MMLCKQVERRPYLPVILTKVNGPDEPGIYKNVAELRTAPTSHQRQPWQGRTP